VTTSCPIVPPPSWAGVRLFWARVAPGAGGRRTSVASVISLRSSGRRSRLTARATRLLGILAAVAALAGCQVRVAVDTHVERDGHGMLTVGVGLDDKALSRVGDLDREVRVGDLTAAGWQVGKAEKASDGLTWLRATKPFASMDELNHALAELTGEPAMFRDYRLVDADGATLVTHHLTGTVDATKGMAAFTDAQLGARLGGDPVAARVAAIEKEEGKNVADMVAFDVTAAVGDVVQVWHPRLGDAAPTVIDVVARDAQPAASVGGGVPLGAMAGAGALVLAMLVGARRRFRRSSR
jgi:hypothetical protein